MYSTLSILAALLCAPASAASRTYTDSRGDTFTTDKDKPTLVTWAHTAVSLHNYGLGDDQLLGTYGEYINDGSDFDFESPEAGSTFPADPDREELEFLKRSANLSPGCEETAGYCVEFNIDNFIKLSPDFLLIHGYRHSPWGIADLIPNITAAGFPEGNIIYNEVSMEVGPDGKNCTDEHHQQCYGRSMIDLIETYMELADFLNLDEPPGLAGQVGELCAAAARFSANMKAAHEKGLRAMPAYLSTGTSYFAHVTDDPVLRMMEELGAPIIHPGACPDKEACTFEYFWEWIPMDQYFNGCTADQIGNLTMTECSKETLYPVDFWLYDHRTTQTVTTDEFAENFPDPALLQGQMGMWAIGGRKITPGHAAEILNNVGDLFAGSDQIHPGTECTPADVSGVAHRTAGLGPGEYACYDEGFRNEKYFEKCGEGGGVSTMSGGARREVSVLAGVVAAGLLL